MIATIILAALAVSPNMRTQCDGALVNRTLKHIEIADYDASATPPPPIVKAELYALVAQKVAGCGKSPRHFMDTAVHDYLQAADFAILSGREYLVVGESSHACAVFRKAESYFASAYSTRPSRDLDVLMLRATQGHRAALNTLLRQHCRGGT